MKNFFCRNSSVFEGEYEAISEIKGDLKLTSLDDGVILPLRKTTLSKRNTYEGGVANSKFEFVAGYFRKKNNFKVHKTCVQSYFPEKEVEYRDEEVIFAGIYFNHFGHIITDGFARLWYVAKGNLKNKKILFVNEPGNKHDWMSVLSCLGLTKDDVIVLHEDANPIRFRKVHIPDQSFFFFESYHKDMALPYNLIRDNISGKSKRYQKIYLSRTLLKDPDCINESYFESLYQSLGFEILHLQNMSFSEQVAAIASADEVVSTVGTLTHMAMFGKEEMKLTGLLRSSNILPKFQYLVDKARKLQFTYVDVSCNFLPSHGDFRAYYIGPNENWRRYFLAKYDKLINRDIYDYIDNVGHNFGSYLKRWMSVALKKNSFKFIAQASVYDIVEDFDKVEYSELSINSEARFELRDIYGVEKKVLGKRFNLFVSRDGSSFNYDRTFELSKGGRLDTIIGKPHHNEVCWKIKDGNLKFIGLNDQITHEYFEPKIVAEKLFFTGFFRNNPFVVFRLEEVVNS